MTLFFPSLIFLHVFAEVLIVRWPSTSSFVNPGPLFFVNPGRLFFLVRVFGLCCYRYKLSDNVFPFCILRLNYFLQLTMAPKKTSKSPSKSSRLSRTPGCVLFHSFQFLYVYLSNVCMSLVRLKRCNQRLCSSTYFSPVTSFSCLSHA